MKMRVVFMVIFTLFFVLLSPQTVFILDNSHNIIETIDVIAPVDNTENLDARVSVFADINTMCVDVENNSDKPNPERRVPNNSRPYIALTFDDGPNIETTSKILDILDKYAARATFFILGNRITNLTSPLLERMIESESEIGSHSWDHPILPNLTQSAIANQFDRTANRIYSAVGIYPTLIRPPYGAVNNTVMSLATRPIVLWSVDPKDWESRDAEKIVDAVLSTVKSGDIVLLHDIYPTTVEALEPILQALIDKNYQFVTVSQLLALRGDTIEAGKKYY